MGSSSKPEQTLLRNGDNLGSRSAVMLANGVTIAMMVDLVRSGLATATPQRVRAGREVLEVPTLRITDAGRKVLVD